MVEPLTDDKRSKFAAIFNQNKDGPNFIGGVKAKLVFQQSGLDNGTLGAIWGLADVDNDGKLVFEEFCIAMHLIMFKKKNPLETLPFTLPSHLLPPGHVQAAPPMMQRSPQQMAMSTSLNSTDSFHGPWEAAPPLPLSRGNSFQGTPPLAVTTPPGSTPPLAPVGSASMAGAPAMHLGLPAKGYCVEQELQKEEETLRYKIGNILNAMRQVQELVDTELPTVDERRLRLAEAKSSEETLAKQQLQLEQLKEQLLTFSARIENLVTESRNKGDKLDKQNSVLVKEIEGLRDDQRQNTAAVEASVRLGQEAERHLAALRATLTEIDTSLRKAGIAVSDLESEVVQQRSARRVLQEEVEHQNDLFEAMVAKAKTLIEQREALQSDVAACEAQLAETNENLNFAKGEQEKEKTSIIELTTKRSELQRELNAVSLAGKELGKADHAKYEASLKAIKEHTSVLKEIEETLGLKTHAEGGKSEWGTDWADTSVEWNKGFAPPTVAKERDEDVNASTPVSWGFHSPVEAAPRAFPVGSAEWGFSPEQPEADPGQKDKRTCPALPDFDAPPIPKRAAPAVPTPQHDDNEWLD